jgi:hypothetical protein
MAMGTAVGAALAMMPAPARAFVVSWNNAAGGNWSGRSGS